MPHAAIVSRTRLGWNAIRLLLSRALRGDVLDKDSYTAFISYRHVEPDRGWAIWLHGALESYVIPSPLRKGSDRKRIGRIFRDEEELAASPHLSEDIREALRRSDWLIVVCSPRAKGSEWVDAEIRYFCGLGRGDRILALLIEGDPGTAFPASLYEIRQPVSGNGVLDRDEFLAADVRPDRERSAREAHRLAKLRLLAPILGCRFDDLRDREQKRRFRRTVAMGTAGLVGLAVFGSLVFFLESSRKEAAQRTADAERKAAEAIISDLGLELGKPLTPRQRQALWKLAVARDPIKHDFVLILAGNPEETVRVSPGLVQISRALGLRGASQAVDVVLKQIGQTTNPNALLALARAVQALPVKLTEAQASHALDPVLKQIGQTTNPFALLALARAVQALPANLTEAQALQALDPVLKQIDQPTIPYAVLLEAQALQALAAKLTEAQASQAVDVVLKRIGPTTDPMALWALAEALKALPAKLTEAQASQAVDVVLKRIGQTTNPNALRPLVQAFQALVAKLIAQASQTTNPQALAALAAKLAAKLTEAQASHALDPVLKQIGQTTDPLALLPLARQALPASQAVDVVLKQIGQTTSSYVLARLADALQALAAKLTEAQASQAASAAASSLGWAASDDEAAAWAKALVALTRSAANRDRMLVDAIAYPSSAAAAATDVLLDAIRAGHPDAPAKEAGTELALAWLAKNFPEILRPPVCPPPLQQQADLNCPSSAIQ
jgi:TIR domain